MPSTKSALHQCQDVFKWSTAGVAVFLLFLASATVRAQGQRWVVPPKIIDFGGATPTLLPLPGSPTVPYRVANGVVDSSGSLLFYVIASGNAGIEVYSAAGALIGSLPTTGSNFSHQIALVPVPGHCNRYYILYFSSHVFIGLDLNTSVVDLDANQILSSVVVATYSDNRGALAISRPRADGSRLLYAMAFPSLQKFVIGTSGITLDSTLIDSNSPPYLGVNFFSTQATLTADGTKLAWNDRSHDVIWVASLDPAGNLVAPLRSYASGPTAGLAFSPDGMNLFFSSSSLPGSGGISVLALAPLNPTPLSLGLLSTAYAGSMLQPASDGLIYAASSTDLGAINPVTSTFTPHIVAGVVTGTLAGLPVDGGRTLPYQVSGEPQLTCEALCGNPALIQGSFGTPGNFELVTPFPGGGIAHYWRDNDSGYTWYGPTTVFGTNVGTVDAVSLIQSTFGGGKNLEVVARVGDHLEHFWRDASYNWYGPTAVFASGVSGTPSFIQGNIGAPGNFELVTPLVTGGMAYYSRNNVSLLWSAPVTFGTSVGVVSDVSLIQSTFGGNLEVVARVGNQLVHFWRDSTSTWNGPTASFASGISGAPSLIQGRLGTPGNFEVVAPRVGGGMVHYWRNNQTLTWSGPVPFGGGNVRSVSLIQSTYGDNLELAARIDCCLVHYWRDSYPSFAWSQSTPIDSCPP